MKRRQAPAGDLVYLSERKLFNLAIQEGLRTGSLASRVELEGSTGAKAGLPPLAEVSAGATVRAEHEDPARRGRAGAKLLQEVTRRLADEGRLRNLERNERGIREGGWFRFHRNLRFGIGTDDSAQSVRALIAVDRDHVPHGLSVPGLLMNGSPAHVLPPYGQDALEDAPGSRSGSGTGRLFVWLDAVRRALEEDPTANPSAIEVETYRSDHPPRHPHTAVEMYGLFARDGWLDTPRFPQLLHGCAPCEGIAQASFIAVVDEMTLVMASPLYIRVRPL